MANCARIMIKHLVADQVPLCGRDRDLCLEGLGREFNCDGNALFVCVDSHVLREKLVCAREMCVFFRDKTQTKRT